MRRSRGTRQGESGQPVGIHAEATNGTGTEPGGGRGVLAETAALSLLTLAECGALCRASKSSIRRWASDPSTGFPAPIRLPGGQVLRWWKGEVEAWLRDRPRHQPRALRGAA